MRVAHLWRFRQELHTPAQVSLRNRGALSLGPAEAARRTHIPVQVRGSLLAPSWRFYLLPLACGRLQNTRGILRRHQLLSGGLAATQELLELAHVLLVGLVAVVIGIRGKGLDIYLSTQIAFVNIGLHLILFDVIYMIRDVLLLLRSFLSLLNTLENIWLFLHLLHYLFRRFCHLILLHLQLFAKLAHLVLWPVREVQALSPRQLFWFSFGFGSFEASLFLRVIMHSLFHHFRWCLMFIHIQPLFILRIHLLPLLEHLCFLLVVVLKIQLDIEIILVGSCLLHVSNCWNVVGVIILHVEHHLVFVNVKKTRQEFEFDLFSGHEPCICQFVSIGCATSEFWRARRCFRRGVQRDHLLLVARFFTCLQLHLSLNFIHRHNFLLACHLTVYYVIFISHLGRLLFGVTLFQVVDNICEVLLLVMKPLNLFVHMV